MHDERQLALITSSDRRRLVRAATRLLGPAEAEDAVQDACVRALEADVVALNAAQAWLLTVLRNLAIDQLRRRSWLQHWLAEAAAGGPAPSVPSAEADAALAEEAALALRLLATRLTPTDGAAVLLHEVFELSHAEIALASGKSVDGCRQLLRRALLRLRRARDEPAAGSLTALGVVEDTTLRLYLQSLQLRDPQALLAMLRQPPTLAAVAPAATNLVEPNLPASTCGVVQVGGQLGLVLTLDGVTLCVLPLGAQQECGPLPALL